MNPANEFPVIREMCRIVLFFSNPTARAWCRHSRTRIVVGCFGKRDHRGFRGAKQRLGRGFPQPVAAAGNRFGIRAVGGGSLPVFRSRAGIRIDSMDDCRGFHIRGSAGGHLANDGSPVRRRGECGFGVADHVHFCREQWDWQPEHHVPGAGRWPNLGDRNRARCRIGQRRRYDIRLGDR